MKKIGNRTQSGLTLIELMIAVALGLIILAAVGQLFLTSKATYNLEEGLARTQESGRFAMEFLAQDIRMAGYAGCNNPSEGCGLVPNPPLPSDCPTSCCNNVSPADESSSFFGEGIRGYVYTGGGSNNRTDWSPALPAVYFIDGEVKAGTDVFLIQYAESLDLHLVGNPVPDNANIQIPSNSVSQSLLPDDILMVSDCKSTDIIRATNVGSGDPVTIAHSQVGNVRPQLGHAYGNDAELLRLRSRAYFVAVNAVSGEPALMRKELTAAGLITGTEELVPGVEFMRLMYGVDTDVTARDWIANRYVIASNVVDLSGPGTTNWNHVVSVRLGLLIRTPTNVTQEADTRQYKLADGVSVDPPNDFRRRQVYRTTIQLRNN